MIILLGMTNEALSCSAAVVKAVITRVIGFIGFLLSTHPVLSNILSLQSILCSLSFLFIMPDLSYFMKFDLVLLISSACSA